MFILKFILFIVTLQEKLQVYNRTLRNSRQEVFCIKMETHPQENTCAEVYFLIKLQVSGLEFCQKKDTGTGVFL